MTEDEIKDDAMQRIQPHLERLQFELTHLAWSSRSVDGVTGALAAIRKEIGGERGGEFVDMLVWFLASFMAQMRPPTDKEAAELELSLTLYEELRELNNIMS